MSSTTEAHGPHKGQRKAKRLSEVRKPVVSDHLLFVTKNLSRRTRLRE